MDVLNTFHIIFSFVLKYNKKKNSFKTCPSVLFAERISFFIKEIHEIFKIYWTGKNEKKAKKKKIQFRDQKIILFWINWEKEEENIVYKIKKETEEIRKQKYKHLEKDLY